MIFRQLAGLSTAIAEMHQAVGELDRAQELQELSRQQLASIAANLQARDVRAHTQAEAYAPSDRRAPSDQHDNAGPER